MKKILLMLIFISLPCFAFAKDDITLQCSFITSFTDIYVQYKPYTITKKGKIVSDKKIVGNTEKIDNSDTLEFLFDNGTSIIFDTKNGLAMYTFKLDGEPVYSYGSCFYVK